jgi:hypothetical protein
MRLECASSEEIAACRSRENLTPVRNMCERSGDFRSYLNQQRSVSHGRTVVGRFVLAMNIHMINPVGISTLRDLTERVESPARGARTECACHYRTPHRRIELKPSEIMHE